MLRNDSGIGQDEEMPKHSHFRTEGPDPIEGSEDLFSMSVSFVPADYPQIQITWEYVLRSRDYLSEEGLVPEERVYVLRDGEILYPSGMRIEPWAGTPTDEWLHVSASFIRDMPTARLERAARLLVEASEWDGPSPGSIAELARELVRERWPDLDPGAGAGAARRWNRLVRLAEVVHEHQAARARGEKAPANAVAEDRGVEPSTVRSWLHQAKQEGITPRPMQSGKLISEIVSDRLPNADYRKN